MVFINTLTLRMIRKAKTVGIQKVIRVNLDRILEHRTCTQVGRVKKDLVVGYQTYDQRSLLIYYGPRQTLDSPTVHVALLIQARLRDQNFKPDRAIGLESIVPREPSGSPRFDEDRNTGAYGSRGLPARRLGH